MSSPKYYRGGTNLTPRRSEVKFDKATGLVLPQRGLSVFDRPDNLDRFGGAHEVTNLPEGLRVIQAGRDPHHHEVVPAVPMSFDEFADLLKRIVLVPV
jgi:hypothetical protein